MDVFKFDIDFYFHNYIVAHCSEFMGWSPYPQVYVYALIAGKAEVFNFYKYPDELFWFELLKRDEVVAYAIAQALAKKFKLKIYRKKGLKPQEYPDNIKA